jgi:hypothetical protein
MLLRAFIALENLPVLPARSEGVGDVLPALPVLLWKDSCAAPHIQEVIQ